MNDIAKTGVYLGVAVVAIVVAVLATGSSRTMLDDEDPSADLFPKLTDDTLANSLEIIKFNEALGEKDDGFRVEKQPSGLWTIPSHENYPADAADKLARAATSLIGLKRGTAVTDRRGAHASLGVLDPNDAKEGDQGVGELVIIRDAADKVLAELIIGKEVKGQFGRRYVRIRGQDRVYEVQLDGEQFSHKFEDWIERDLLKLVSSDVRRAVVDDYAAEPRIDLKREQLVIEENRNDRLDLRYNQDAIDDKWSLADLAEGVELDDTKLNNLTFALADLKIVDVRRKPQGLSDYLSGKTQGFSFNAARSLAGRGFFVMSEDRMACSSGEVTVELEDGVVYHLRFGEITATTLSEDGEAKKDAKTAVKKEADSLGVNRYLFVSVTLDKDLIKKPELKPLPGESLLGVKPPPEKEDAKKKEAEKEASDDEKDKEKTKPREPKLTDPIDELLRINEEGLMTKAQYEAKVEEVRRHNQAEQTRYDNAVAEAEKTVKSLNNRFADWYYVIDDAMYKRIMVKREDITKKPEAKDAKKTDEP